MPVLSFNRKSLYVSLAVIAVVAIVWIASSSGRKLSASFLESLRIGKPQSVNVNLSQFVGPNANQSLQQMVTQMVSDQVVTTKSESSQSFADVAAASAAAGFPVKLLASRKDKPTITLLGAEAYNLTVDRNRLQAIFDQAGRHDLIVPQSVNGANVTVRIPRAVILTYGTCPGASSAAANLATPTPLTQHFDDCLILREGPSADISAPSQIDLTSLSEIALELAGMTPREAHRFLTAVNWRLLLGVSFPRFMRSYQSVTVDGVPGTLLALGGREGPDYALFWAKNTITYSLRGFGDTSSAAKLASSLT
jgi:hypothetical protein